MSEDRHFFANRKPRKCPACGEGKVVPIVYGYPGGEMIRKSGEGEITLGGCVISPEDPSWQCLACDAVVYRHSSH